MTLDQLKTLSDESLLELAGRLGLELPDGLDKVFVIEEVYEALEDEKREEEELSSPALRIGEKKYSVSPAALPSSEGGPLPEFYNETYIRLMPRDALWAYAYWEVREQDLEAITSAPGFAGLVLRIEQLAGESIADRFDIAVKPEDSSWYFNIPQPGARYRAALFAVHGKKESGIARSLPMRAPTKAIADYIAQASGDFDKLLELSGYGSLGLEGGE